MVTEMKQCVGLVFQGLLIAEFMKVIKGPSNHIFNDTRPPMETTGRRQCTERVIMHPA